MPSELDADEVIFCVGDLRAVASGLRDGARSTLRDFRRSWRDDRAEGDPGSFGREVDGATVQKHFIVGENQFRKGQYAAAAESYRLSIAAEPTLSAELNRGLAFLLASKYSPAKTPLQTGLARSGAKDDFAAVFRAGLGAALSTRGQAGYGGDLCAPGPQWFRA